MDMKQPPVLSPQNNPPPPATPPPAKRQRMDGSNNNNNIDHDDVITRPPILDLYLPENDDARDLLVEDEPDFEWDNFGWDWVQQGQQQQQGGAPEYPLEHFYQINGRDQTRGSRTRRSHVEDLSLTLRNLEDLNGPYEPLLTRIFRQLINNAIEAGHTSGYNGQPRWIAVQLTNENFREPFYVPLRPPQQNSAESIVASLTWLQGQYGDELHIFELPLRVKIQAIWSLNDNQRGNGGCPFHATPIPGLHGKKPRSLFLIENDDSYCLSRAINVGLYWLHTGKNLAQTRRYAGDEANLSQAAVRLLQLSGCQLNKQQYDFDDAQRIANYLNGGEGHIRIVVMDADQLFKVVFRSSERPMNEEIVLILHNRHYDFIGEAKHIFKKRIVQTVKEWPNQRYITIENANGTVNSVIGSFLDRGNGQYSICSDRRICQSCGGVIYRRGRPHHCTNQNAVSARRPCEQCGIVHDAAQPFCYITSMEEDDGKAVRYVFFDVETSQETPLSLTSGEVVRKHLPVLLVAEILCSPCMDQGITVDNNDQRAHGCVCGVFGQRGLLQRYNADGARRRLIFHCFDDEEAKPEEEFLDFLLETGPRETKSLIISHNGGKFDIYFILELLFYRGVAPKTIAKGLKLYQMQTGGRHSRKLCFKDSLNFFSCKLSDLHKTFDLGKDGIPVKPWFPYLFIRRENFNTRLNELPALQFYGPDQMKPEDRSRFLQWHAENRHQLFCLRDALVEYCTNDVTILTRACVKFRQQLRSITQKIEPFRSACTIAKLTMNIFRAEFLRRNMIVNLPEGGINFRGRQSHEALMYFRTLERMNGWQVRTAEYSVGEMRAPQDPRNGSRYRVDGYVERANGPPHYAIEFYGCFYHGCPQCFPDRQTILADGRTAEELYAATQLRAHHLRQHFNLWEQWECTWKALLRRDPEVKAAYDECFVPPPLHPRKHALREGRCEALQLHVKATDDEVIEYVDVISMYPWCMKYGVFPIGQPTLVVVNELPRGSIPSFPWTHPAQNPFKGLILCKVLAPEVMTPPDLPPLLPYLSEKNKKLMFPLCARCADTLSSVIPCPHTDDQRAWIAGFTHLELNKALELGYRVIDVYEAEHYENWSSRQNNDLFGDFIDSCLKMKVQASGWPVGVETPEQRLQYIQEFFAAEGVRLEEEKIEQNPGLRGISKYLLNSSWGKFCQQVMRSEDKYTTTARQTHDILENNQLEVIEVTHLSEQVDRVVFRYKPTVGNMIEKTPPTNNITIATFVTSQARLRLFSINEEAIAKGHKPFYMDTDSLMLKRNIGSVPLRLGKNLDDLSQELPGRRIVEVVLAGGKHYVICHVDAVTGGDMQYLIKVRGITLTHAARQKVTFETMKNLVFQKFGQLDDAEDPIEEPTIRFPQICRDKYGRIFTRDASKIYRVVFDKRVVINTQKTVPYGTR